MTAIKLAVTETRRLLTGVLPKLAMLALVLVPVLYSATYLYANWDPYGNLDDVKAAIVNEDVPATAGDQTVDAGSEVASNLKESGTFDFETTSAADAAAGVKDGTYAFAITIPATFSQNLTSAADFDPQQAVLQVTTNDANNYLVGTIADKVSSTVRESVSEQVGEDAANRFLLGFSDIHGKLLEAADGAGQLASGADQLKAGSDELKAGTSQAKSGADELVTGEQQLVSGSQELDAGAGELSSGADQLATGAGALADGLQQMEDQTAGLPAATAKLADGAQQVADGNAKIATVSGEVATAAQSAIDGAPQARAELEAQLQAAGVPQDQIDQALATVDELFAPVQDANAQLQTANSQIQQLASGAQQVADGAAQLAAQTPALTDGISQASAGADEVSSGAQQLASGAQELAAGAGELAAGQQQALDGATALAAGLGQLDTGAGQLNDGLAQLASGAHTLQTSLTDGASQVPNPDDPTRTATADQIANPVQVANTNLAKAANYGSGLAPFFLGLSLWVGAFTLFLIIKPLSDRALAGFAPRFATALGGWLPAAALGLLQAGAVYLVATLAVGLDPVNGWLTFGVLAAAALSFTAFLHGLNAKFGAIGKFAGLLLLILQLVSAGGTFPWETTPEPMHALHAVLPLGYVVDALRSTIYGGSLSGIGLDLGVLAIYLCVGLALSTWAAASGRTWSLKRLRPELEL